MFKQDSGFGKLSFKFQVSLVSLLLLIVFAGCKKQTTTSNFTLPTPGGDNAHAVSGPPVTSYADVVSRVTPAVVTIRSARRVRTPEQFPFMDDPFFQQFFGNRGQQGNPRGQEQVQRGLGSGVVVHPDGYILTNHHVVDGAQEIKVDIGEGRTLSAKLVGSDAPSDLAVLKVDAHDLPVLALGDSDKVRVGDVVLAVGNPLGIGQTVTMGIISAKGRQTGLSDGSFEDFLQTDAPINHGNSGGALVNTNGELIGINSQILSPSGGNIGIGFAIPANMARNVLEQLVKNGKVKRGMLGVTIQPITSDIAQSLGLKEAHGALVNSVQPGGPADKAGLKRGDVITAFNGQSISDSNTLRNMVAGTPPGTTITITYVREGREQQANLTLAELPADRAASQQQGGDEGGGDVGSAYGMQVEPLTPQLAERLGIKGTDQGVVVTNIDPNGPAAEAGIQAGDVIQEVNHQPVRSASDLTNAIKNSGSRPALILINRRGTTVYLTLHAGQ